MYVPAMKLNSFLCMVTYLFINSLSYGDIGDITKDGVIDGRDALRILRIVDGLESADADEILRGDVYPVSGTDGRQRGDGVLTREDANQILLQSVGLIPKGEVTGEFSDSPPHITDFSPRSGPVGTRVIIQGENFLSALSGDNEIFIGGTASRILEISGTRITTEVPVGAQTGVIRVRTPGGVADSSGSFHVTDRVQGQLNLPDGLSSKDFTVVSIYDERPIVSEDGSYDSFVSQDELTLIGGASNGTENNTFLTLVIPRENQIPQLITIDARSTAKALVFLHPFLMTRDVSAAQMLSDIMDGLPEIEELAKTIERRYPAGADGIDDPEVGVAWNKAVAAVMDALPQEFTTQVGGNFSGKKLMAYSTWNALQRKPYAGSGPIDGDFKPLAKNMSDIDVRVYGVDRHYLSAEYNPYLNNVTSSLDNGYSPLDWIVTLHEIHPDALPTGFSSHFTHIQANGLKHGGFGQSTLIPSDQWTLRIDIIKTGVKWAVDSIFDWLKTDTKSITLPHENESTYIIRAYSGAIRDYQGWDNQAIRSIDGGPQIANSATVVNVVLALVDMWYLVGGDEKEISQAVIKKGIIFAHTGLNREIGNTLLGDLGEERGMDIITRNVLVEGMKGIATETANKGISKALKKVETTFSKSLKNANALLKALNKISSFGRIAERIAGLMGYLINPYDMELSPGPTPLETMLVVVGDPFDPIITRISPREGGELTVVTVDGEHFASNPQENEVYVGDSRAEILSGNHNQLTIRIPTGLIPPREEWTSQNIYVRNQASDNLSRSADSFTIIRAPVVDSVEPVKGYAPNTETDSKGTLVQFKGFNLTPLPGASEYIVRFNDTPAAIITQNDNYLTVNVPELAPGDYDVTLYDSYSRIQSATFPFTVFGPPKITTISQTSAQAGERIEITGNNFHQAYIVFEHNGTGVESLSDNRFQITMPSVIPDNEYLRFYIQNPAGRTEIYSIKRLPGISVPSLPSLPNGYFLTVNSPRSGIIEDKLISLDEAAGFINGTVDLTKFEDDNLKSIIPRSQNKDENDNLYWTERSMYDVTPDEPNNGTAAHEYHEIWRRDTDINGKVSEYRYQVIDLDEKIEDREEADQLVFRGAEEPEFSGAIATNYKHEISVSSLMGDFGSIGFTLPTQSVITIPPNLKVTFSNSIIMEEGSLITMGRADLSEPIRMKSASRIRTLSLAAKGDAAYHLEDAFGVTIESATIESGEKDGIVVEGGGANNISTDIINCKGTAVIFRDSQENIFGSKKIENCAGGGVHLQNDRFDKIYAAQISDCGFGIKLDNCTYIETFTTRIDRSGIYAIAIQGGRYNTLRPYMVVNDYYGYISKCTGTGLYIVNSTDNSISGFLIEECPNDAIHMGPGAKENVLDNIGMISNQNGLVLEGADTAYNTFTGLHPGLKRTKNNIYISGRNENFGVLIRSGANHNTFENLAVFNSGSSGVVLEDDGTDYNIFNYAQIGAFIERYHDDSQTQGNEGDGFTLLAGASYNRFNQCMIGRNKGNGISIMGRESEENIIQKCKIGADYTLTGGKTNVKENFGNGISIESAPGTQILDCDLKVNVSGGIEMFNLQTAPIGMAYTAIVKNNTISGNTNAFVDLIAQNPSLVIGDGILLTDCRRVLIEDNSITAMTDGISIHGETSGNNVLWENSVGYVKNNGLVIEKSAEDSIHSLSLNGIEKQGIYAVGAVDTVLTNLMIQGTNSHGINLESCANLNFTDMELYSVRGDSDGLHISDSQDLEFHDYFINVPGRHGIYVGEGTVDVLFDGIGVDYANQACVFLMDSEGIVFTGEIPRPKFLKTTTHGMSWGKDAGIVIRNSKRVRIGEDNRGFTVSYNAKQGILIQGDETEDVLITSTHINNNSEGGVVVEGGRKIRIGGTSSILGNHIERNPKGGIIAQGASTDLSILNNLIGSAGNFYYGSNDYGIILQGEITRVLMAGNSVNSSRNGGILLREGAHHNQISSNHILSNGGDGVRIEGSTSVNNMVSKNSISGNLRKGIRLEGGNQSLPSPLVHYYDGKTNNLQGNMEVPNGSVIEFYIDKYDEGEQMIAAAKVKNGHFTASGIAPKGRQVHAIAILHDGDTSEFGNAIFHANPSSPTSKTFVYASNPTGQYDIFLNDPMSDFPVQLTHDNAQDTNPQLSTNGSQIIFVSNRTGNSDLWMMDRLGEDLMPIVTDSAEDIQPAWEPGGNRLLFVSNRDGNSEIYTMTVDPNAIQGEVSYGEDEVSASQNPVTGEPGDAVAVRFTTLAGSLSHFWVYLADAPAPFTWKVMSWENNAPGAALYGEGQATPASTGWQRVDTGNLPVPGEYLIALYFEESGKPAIGLANGGLTNRWWSYSTVNQAWSSHSFRPFMIKAFVAPSPPQRLTVNNASDLHPAWSPDGQQIVFVSDRGGNNDLWVMNADGTGARQLTDGVGNNTKPAWSYQDNRIAFVSDRDGDMEIYTIQIDGTGLNRLTHSPGIDDDPIWEPSGSSILFSSDRNNGREIYSMWVDFAGVTRLTVTSGDSIDPHIASGSRASGKKGRYQPTQTPDPLYVSVTEGEGKAGDTIQLTLQVESAYELGNLEFELLYDNAFFRLVDLPSGAFLQDSLYVLNPNDFPDRSGWIRFNWVRSLGFSGKETVLGLRFQINTDTPSKVSLIDLGAIRAFNLLYEEIPIVFKSGTLTIQGDQTRINSWMFY